jgi:hypothetical protein
MKGTSIRCSGIAPIRCNVRGMMNERVVPHVVMVVVAVVVTEDAITPPSVPNAPTSSCPSLSVKSGKPTDTFFNEADKR